jgi:hypothetical protein
MVAPEVLLVIVTITGSVTADGTLGLTLGAGKTSCSVIT